MYKKILVPLDGSPISDRGLTEAIGIARMSGAQIRIIHVIDAYVQEGDSDLVGVLSGHLITKFEAAGRAILDQARARAAADGVAAETVMVEIRSGRVADKVIEEANAWKADLLVIGTHGRRGVQRALLGSDAEQIARLAPAPVMLVRLI